MATDSRYERPEKYEPGQIFMDWSFGRTPDFWRIESRTQHYVTCVGLLCRYGVVDEGIDARGNSYRTVCVVPTPIPADPYHPLLSKKRIRIQIDRGDGKEMAVNGYLWDGKPLFFKGLGAGHSDYDRQVDLDIDVSCLDLSEPC